MQRLKESKFLKYLLKTIKTLGMVFIIVVIGIIIIQRIFNNNVSILGYRIFTVATGSMEPVYKVMDIILVKETKDTDIKVGDDLVYMGKSGDFNGKIITHRVIKKETKDGVLVFHTQGIANTAEDPEIYFDQIYGKVVYKGIALSFINKIINNPVGFYFLIVIPIAVLITLEIIDRKKEKENKPKEEEILDIDE